jgi:hypothetical protein
MHEMTHQCDLLSSSVRTKSAQIGSIHQQIYSWAKSPVRPLTRGGSERIESATLGILHVHWQQAVSLCGKVVAGALVIR